MRSPVIYNEKSQSQLPALRQLIALGYTYKPSPVALAERNQRTDNILLEGVLRDELNALNRISYKDKPHLFTEANIQHAIKKLKEAHQAKGLHKKNEAIYELLTYGTSLEQIIDGSKKSYDLNYIDWRHPERNAFHVTAEFSVEHERGSGHSRPDIVLFVNGIPLVVIECKAPSEGIDKAISQLIHYQNSDQIPQLFPYIQMIMAVNKNKAKYATAGSDKAFWFQWHEKEYKDEDMMETLRRPLSDSQLNALSQDFPDYRPPDLDESYVLTEQDKLIHSLCHPKRLLDLVRFYTLFDNGIKKIARYQQFFTVRSAMERLRNPKEQNRREGGIVWHTQGSGKSLTMVMLARMVLLDKDTKNSRMILVADRQDLDQQLKGTFQACQLEPHQAHSGRELIQLIKDKRTVITTLIQKFDTGWQAEKHRDPSNQIIVLVDESHRSNFGSLSAQMRKILPNACFIGFTGTPLLQKKRNSFQRFGDLIKPSYTMQEAIADKAVVPLLYEARLVDVEQDEKAIDTWFERHTADLNEKQKVDLKRKYARARQINKTEGVVYMRAFDINKHFVDHWQNTGFKGQLVTPDKATAIRYHEALQGIGGVSSQVLISAPNQHEGHDEVGDESKESVVRFWNKMMHRYGDEKQYNEKIISTFKAEGNDIEIIIVVDKLLVGFDAPRNTVLYLCRSLREHKLLQAIARVNRVHEGKEFGYILDYENLLSNLDQALTMYDVLKAYREEDIAETFISVDKEVEKLAQYHSDLWDIFKEVRPRGDADAYERYLADEERRHKFYDCLIRYSKVLGIALSSEKFVTETDEGRIKTYKADLRLFLKLRKAVACRYADEVDYTKEHEQKIQKLLDKHIQADNVIYLNKPVDIFDQTSFDELKEQRGVHAKKKKEAVADEIANNMLRVISEIEDEDPAFCKKFSTMIQEAIDEFRNGVIASADEYLQRIIDIHDKFVAGRKGERDDVPESIRNNPDACAYYGIIKENVKLQESDEVIAFIAQGVATMINAACQKTSFWYDSNAQNEVEIKIDDFLCDNVGEAFSVTLQHEEIIAITQETMALARKRKRHMTDNQTLSFRYGRLNIVYALMLSSRKTLQIAVRPDKSVIVKAPKRLHPDDIHKRVQKRASWIEKQIDFFDRYHPRTPARCYVAGETHLYLGRPYRLKIDLSTDNKMWIDGYYFRIKTTSKEPEHIKGILDDWYRAQAYLYFQDIFQHCWQLYKEDGMEKPELKIQQMKTRWGSLSRKGRLTLNQDLIKASKICIEYVIVHELCHLVHFNHNRDFYHLLDTRLPDWQDRKFQLEKTLS